AAGDPQAVALEADDLARVVRQQADRAQSEIEQNLRADAVVAQVRLETERLVRLHRVLPLVLQRIRADLVRQPDAAAFLPHVHERALSLLVDAPHGRVQLLAAVAAQRDRKSTRLN